MNDVLKLYIGTFCIVYLDDIIIISKTAEEYHEHLRKVMKLLRDNKLYVNPEKCSFFMDEVNYLGHIVSKDGLRADPKKTQVVRNCPEDKDRHDVRAFLGLSNYFRRFVKDYGQIAVGLTRLTKESVPFAWDSRAQQSFDKLREALNSPPIQECHSSPSPLQLNAMHPTGPWEVSSYSKVDPLPMSLGSLRLLSRTMEPLTKSV